MMFGLFGQQRQPQGVYPQPAGGMFGGGSVAVEDPIISILRYYGLLEPAVTAAPEAASGVFTQSQPSTGTTPLIAARL